MAPFAQAGFPVLKISIVAVFFICYFPSNVPLFSWLFPALANVPVELRVKYFIHRFRNKFLPLIKISTTTIVRHEATNG